MLSNNDKLDIIKQSIAGQIEGPAYKAIAAAEQQQIEQEAPQSDQQSQIPQIPVGPPPAQTIPVVYDQQGALIKPGEPGVGLNQMAGTSHGQTIQPGEYKTGGPKNGNGHDHDHDHKGLPANTSTAEFQHHLTDFKKYYGDYMQSDAYKRRLQSSGDYGDENRIQEVTDLRLNALNDISMKVTGQDDPDMGSSSFMDTKDNKMTLNTSKEFFNKFSTIGHEAGHAIGGSFDQYSPIRTWDLRSNYDKRSLSLNDIKLLEDKNVLWQNAPNRSINDTENHRVWSGSKDAMVQYYPPLSNYASTQTVRKGSPTIDATQNYSTSRASFDSPEEFVRQGITFGEGYDEEAKEKEISRLITEWTKQDAKGEQFQSLKNKLQDSRNSLEEISNDYSHIGNREERIQFQINANKRDVETYVLGSKDLPRKYRKMSLDEIPDGVNSEIDNYRKSLSIQKQYSENLKAFKAIKNTPDADTKIRGYTPEGGDQLVFKEGSSHDVSASESYADLVGMREYLHRKHNFNIEDDITIEQYNQFIKNDPDLKRELAPNRFTRKYKAQDAVHILNNVADAKEEIGDDLSRDFRNARTGGPKKKLKNGGPTDPPHKKKYNDIRESVWNYLDQTGADTTYVNIAQDLYGMHESNDNYSADQKGGGPGKGRYQYETGPNAGGNTAGNYLSYLINNYVMPTLGLAEKPKDPTFYKLNQQSNDLNASYLQPGTQDALFVADKLFDAPAADFRALVSKDRKSPPTLREYFNFWGEHHKKVLDSGKAWNKATSQEKEAEWEKFKSRTKNVKLN